MDKNEKSEWQKIESDVYNAFQDVKLENGIGYHEAGAIENYLQPTSIKYQQEKAKDEKEDWRKLLIEYKNIILDDSRHCFMDAKGLRFYLPFWMIRKDVTINSILYFYISETYEREGYSAGKFTECISLLSKEQKQCIYHFYSYLIKTNHPDFQEEFLNGDFDTGEEKMKEFNFMEFIKKQFQTN